MNRYLRSFLLIIAAVIAVFFLVERIVQPGDVSTHLDYGQFYAKLEAGQVHSFHSTGLQVNGDLTSGEKYSVVIPNTDQTFVNEVQKKVKSGQVSFDEQANTNFLTTLLTTLPFLLVLGLVLFLLRQAQAGGSQALSFG